VEPALAAAEAADAPHVLGVGLQVEAGELPGEPRLGDVAFRISETAGYAGTKVIEYAVYLSDDAGIGNDTIVAAETLPPLDAYEEVNETFSGTWPNASGDVYYIIIALHAEDEADDSGNIYISSRYVIYDLPEQSGSNDAAGPTDSPLTDVQDLSVRSSGVAVQGDLDGAGRTYDTYKFRLSTDHAAYTVRGRVIWETGSNALDLRFWDESNNESVSNSTLYDEEPGIEKTGLPSGAGGYYFAIEPLENAGRYYLILSIIPQS
jgi:hypothetical protein